MEKLAEALPQLADDDLLQVVQMVHDNKTDETYTKNDVESKCRFARSFPPNLQICISSLLWQPFLQQTHALAQR
jgi:hypothetical protein